MKDQPKDDKMTRMPVTATAGQAARFTTNQTAAKGSNCTSSNHMSESPKPPGRGGLPGVSSPGSPPALPADLQKYATTKSSPLSISSSSNSSDSSSSSRSSSPRAFGSGPVTFGLGTSGERGTMVEAAASWSGLRSSPQGSILDHLMSPEPSSPLASAVAKRESERATSPAVSVASALVPHSDRPYPHYPEEILNANLQPLVRAKVRMQKMSFIRTAKRGEASYAELGQQYDEGMATCLANRTKPSDKPPPPVNLPQWMVEWGEKNGVSEGQLRVQRGLLDEQRALLAETLNAGFDDVQRAQQDAAKRQDANFKQLREQNKMASIQQGTALSKLQKGSAEIQSGVESVGEDTTEIKNMLIQLRQDTEIKDMLRKIMSRERDMRPPLSNANAFDTPVASESNALGNESIGVDVPITSSDRSASNASPTAAVVVSNNGAGGGGDTVSPSEPGLSDPSATVAGLSIAGGIPDIPTSEPTSMALAPDNGPASGTSSPTLISAPTATHLLPLADSSTAELASSVTDNPNRPASNEATEDAKAAGAAEAHGGTKASPDVTDIGANASISMVPTSSAPSLLSEDAVETPRPAPNKVPCTKSDTFPLQSNKVAGSAAMPKPSLVSRTDRAEITNKANVQGRRIGALHGTTSLSGTTDASLGKTLATIRAMSTENLGKYSSNLVARRGCGKENGPTSANAPTSSRRGFSARSATNSITFSTIPAKASVESSEAGALSSSPHHHDYRKMMTRKDPLPTIIYFDVDFKKEEQLTVLQVLPLLKKIFDSGIGDPQRLQRAADALNDCLERRGLDHPKCRLRLLQFIADNVSHPHLNHCRPQLSNAFHKLFRVCASQLSTMSPTDVKPLIPMLLAMSSEFLMEPRGPMSSTNLPKTISARNSANQFALLVSANDPMQFMFIGRQLGNAIIETNKPAQKIGCAHSLAIVVEIAPSELIVSLERGTGKKTTKELLSRASIELLAGRNGGEDVRKAGKMLCHRLEAKGYVEISDRIEEKLSKSQKSYLDRSKAAAEEDWERFGAKWLSENSRLN